MVVDIVCFLFLIVVYLVLESICYGECDVVLVGGVNLLLYFNKYMIYGVWDMFFIDGYCCIFGKDGDGYVLVEGIGVVLLKLLC